MVQIIGAPFDFGGRRLGSRLGPVAIRLAEIDTALGQIGLECRDYGDVGVSGGECPAEGFPGFESLIACIMQLRNWTEGVFEAGDLPLILGGEHTLAAGGISAALNDRDEHFGLLWIDAHADVHTPDSSASGNIHGMPLGALLGLAARLGGPKGEQWTKLLGTLGPRRLDPSQISWYAIREVDPGERARVKQGFAITMHEIDRFGMEETVNRLDLFWRSAGTRRIWVSFDVDALDPLLAPGTGTAVRGGLSYREAHLLAELLRERLDEPGCPYQLIGIDIMETNPLVDANNQTARMAVEWVASLLGKTILGV